MTSTGALLEIENLELRYGMLRALQGVTLSLAPGESVAIIGPNGAGKTSLARAISGLVKPSAGTIRFAARTVSGWPAHRLRRAGIVYLPEERGIARGLSVADNLRFGADVLPGKRARNAAIERSYELFPVLKERRNQTARTLSGGEQQLLALARALTGDPKLLVVDEMSLGLAPKMIDAVFAGLERAKDADVSILLIEQFVERALDFADRCAVLRRGAIAWSGTTAEARAVDLSDYYFGDEAA